MKEINYKQITIISIIILILHRITSLILINIIIEPRMFFLRILLHIPDFLILLFIPGSLFAGFFIKRKKIELPEFLMVCFGVNIILLLIINILPKILFKQCGYSLLMIGIVLVLITGAFLNFIYRKTKKLRVVISNTDKYLIISLIIVLCFGFFIYNLDYTNNKEMINSRQSYSEVFDFSYGLGNHYFFLLGQPPASYYLSFYAITMTSNKEAINWLSIIFSGVALLSLLMIVKNSSKNNNIRKESIILATTSILIYLILMINYKEYYLQDTFFAVSILLTAYFFFKKNRLMFTIFAINTSLIRYPGIFIVGFLIFFNFIFRKKGRKNTISLSVYFLKIILLFGMVVLILGMFTSGFIMDSSNKPKGWAKAIYFEIVTEHYGPYNISNENTFFKSIKNVLLGTIFLPLLIFIKTNKKSKVLFFTSLLYLSIILTINYIHMRYLFPINLMFITFGLININELKNKKLRMVISYLFILVGASIIYFLLKIFW